MFNNVFVKNHQEKQPIEEDEEDDTFDMDIKVTDPEKVGKTWRTISFDCG